jgi:hypothetical protein
LSPTKRAIRVNPGLVLPAFGESTLAGAVADSGYKSRQWHEASDHPVTSILASSADKEILLVQNGRVVDRAPLAISGATSVGSNVLVLKGLTEGAGTVWTALTHDRSNWDAAQPDDQVLSRLSTTSAFASAMSGAMHPGLVLVTTDLPLHPDSRSGKDFVIMTVEQPVPPIPLARPPGI